MTADQYAENAHCSDLIARLEKAEESKEISKKCLPSNGLNGFERAEEIGLCAAWLDECARYFEKRPINGEDAAYWSNVANAENARKYAALLRALQAKESEHG